MPGTIHLKLKTPYVGRENIDWMFRTEKPVQDIIDIDSYPTPEFTLFLKENYYAEIYSFMEEGCDYDIRYIDDDHIPIVCF